MLYANKIQPARSIFVCKTLWYSILSWNYEKLLLLSFVSIVLFVASCQTIDKKTEEIIKKENEKLSKFIGQPESELKIVMGNPDDEVKNDKGMRFLIYKSKKYTIKCERKFEVDERRMVIGFSSKGCF